MDFPEIGRLINPSGVIPASHLAVCVVSSILVLAIPALRKPAALLLLSGIAAVAIYRRSLFGYLLTGLTIFLFMLVLDSAPNGRNGKSSFRWRCTCVAMLALIIAFLLGRSWQLDSHEFTVGGIKWVLFGLDMWLLLRLITLLWEFGSGRIQRPNLFSYALWIGFPFISFGPVIRYSQFEPQLSSRERMEVIRKTFSTDWLGKFVIAILQITAGVILTNLHQGMYVSNGLGRPLWLKLLDGFGISPWGFLFVWAGYYKLMECLALLWGVTLPPSFNRPFGRSNISEFWANWNMTATSVFRDYLFYNRWGGQSINVYLNTLIIFTLVGMWHSFNLYWVLWGLLHGIGFCIFIWYSQSRQRPSHDNTHGTWGSRLLGGDATYIFVCSCWLLPSPFLKIIGRI